MEIKSSKQLDLPHLDCKWASIKETLDRQDAARKASDKRRKDTREGRKGS